MMMMMQIGGVAKSDSCRPSQSHGDVKHTGRRWRCGRRQPAAISSLLTDISMLTDEQQGSQRRGTANFLHAGDLTIRVIGRR